MDDTTNPVIEEEVVEQEQPQTEEPQVEEPQQVEEPVQETEQEAPQEEEAPQPSRREQLRVQELLKKYGPPQRNAPSNDGPDFRSRVNADEEVYSDLEETAKQYGEQRYNAGQNHAEYTTWRRFLQMDEKAVRTEHPELNPSNKDKYHEGLEKTLQYKYLQQVGYVPGDRERGIPDTVAHPDLSYADFVEAEMEFADELASMKVAATTRNIAKQTSRTGLRPDGSSPKRMDLTKAAEDMSDEELKAAISSSMPRDTRGRFTSNQ